MKARDQTSGGKHLAARTRASTPRESIPPLPANSILSDGASPADRDFAAGTFGTVVLSLGFLIPMICAGIILHFR